MKKISFKNSRGLTLVGDLCEFSKDYIIIMSHGFTGDRHELGRFDIAIKYFCTKKHSTLRFDYSGSGESEDDSLTIAKEVEDLKSAVKYVKSLGYKKIGLFGMSLGALICLNSYSKNISCMVLIGPITHNRENYTAHKFDEQHKKQLFEKGFIEIPKKEGIRKIVIVDKEMFLEREKIKPSEYLKKVKCPVLIMHGDVDTFVPYKDSQDAMKYLSKESKLITLPKDNHHFMGKTLNTILKNSILWYKKCLF